MRGEREMYFGLCKNILIFYNKLTFKKTELLYSSLCQKKFKMYNTLAGNANARINIKDF